MSQSTETVTFGAERARLWRELELLYAAEGRSTVHLKQAQQVDRYQDGLEGEARARARVDAKHLEEVRRGEADYLLRHPEEAKRRREAEEQAAARVRAANEAQRREWELEEERRRQREQLSMEERLAELEEKERLREAQEASQRRSTYGG